MLSLIYRMYREYEHDHDHRPNVLFINPEHLFRLRHEFANPGDLNAMQQLLGMELVIEKDAVQPYVGWIPAAGEAVG